MARRTYRMRFHKQCILIKVGNNIHQLQKISGCFTFCPQALFAPAEEGDTLFGDALLQRLLVHESQHEDNIGFSILNNAGDKAIELDAESNVVLMLGFMNEEAL